MLALCLVATGCKTPTAAPALQTRNVFLITTDGLRWQEVFTGAEPALLQDPAASTNPDRIAQLFGHPDPRERREQLLPFLWSEVATRGQLFGNQLQGSISRVTNGRNFSYPGYNELLTGAPDAKIDSNRALLNPNTNVLEWLHPQAPFRHQVAAVVNWNVIPWILNAPRGQFPVWSGYVLPEGSRQMDVPQLLQDVSADMTPILPGLVFDAFTHHAALDHVKRHRPRVLYVAFGETDEWAHQGRYDRYLVAAKRVDLFIRDLWETCQSLPQYRDKTTFIITTDHGRGGSPKEWQSHGAKIAGSDGTWIAVLGPDTPPLGERSHCAPVTQAQIPATIAAFLGRDFRAAFPHAAPPLPDVIPPRTPRVHP